LVATSGASVAQPPIHPADAAPVSATAGRVRTVMGQARAGWDGSVLAVKAARAGSPSPEPQSLACAR